MWIKLLCSYQTPKGNAAPGDVIEVADAEGERLTETLGVAVETTAPAKAARAAGSKSTAKNAAPTAGSSADSTGLLVQAGEQAGGDGTPE